MNLDALHAELFNAVNLAREVHEILMNAGEAISLEPALSRNLRLSGYRVIDARDLMSVCRDGEHEKSGNSRRLRFGLEVGVRPLPFNCELVESRETFDSLVRNRFGINVRVYINNFVHTFFSFFFEVFEEGSGEGLFSKSPSPVAP